MSYNPTQWKDGDLVTSAKLNKLEQGVAAGGIQIIHCDEHGALDKTWQEIYDGGFGVIVVEGNEAIIYEQILMVSQGGIIALGRNQSELTLSYYIASSPDGYPVYEEGEGGQKPK